MAEGNLGDAKPVGGGLSVMRIHYGPGYRVYLMQRGTALIILLCGGDNRIGEANRPRLADNIPMTEQFTPWDSAEYLQTHEDIAAYLDACFEQAGTDAELIIRALGTVARAKGIDRVAERAGLAPDHLHAMLGSNASPPFGEILRVIEALGIRLHADKAA